MASSSRMVHTDSPSCSTNSCSAAVPALGRGCCHALRVDRKRFAQGGNTDRQHGRDDCRPCPGRRRRARPQQDPTVLTGGRPHARELVSEALTLETAVERFLRWRHRIHAEISTHDHAHHWGGGGSATRSIELRCGTLAALLLRAGWSLQRRRALPAHRITANSGASNWGFQVEAVPAPPAGSSPRPLCEASPQNLFAQVRSDLATIFFEDCWCHLSYI